MSFPIVGGRRTALQLFSGFKYTRSNEVPVPTDFMVEEEFAMTRTRQPAVAGMFYPDNPAELANDVRVMLAEAERIAGSRPVDTPPKALIVPHAGYVYSGPTAAHGYLRLAAGRETIRRVVLLGPSHYVWFEGLAVPTVDAFLTPLGPVPIDARGRAAIQSLPQVRLSDQPHGREHSLEVHIPFLQTVLDEFELLPLAVGEATPSDVAEVLDAVWGGEETAIVISSDLSHYHDYDTARTIDTRTAEGITSMSRTDVAPEEACGCRPVNGMLTAAKSHALTPELLDLRNSGDTAGPKSRVVGYGAWAFR